MPDSTRKTDEELKEVSDERLVELSLIVATQSGDGLEHVDADDLVSCLLEVEESRKALQASREREALCIDALKRAKAELLHHGYYGTQVWIDAALARAEAKEKQP